MGLFGNILKELLDTASDEELADEREKLRLEWLKDGDTMKKNVMDSIDAKMVGRANKKYEKENPNAETTHREHGWYLPNDD